MTFWDEANVFVEGDILFIYHMLNGIAFKLYNVQGGHPINRK